MKFKATLLVLFVFSSLWVFAQQANNARQNAPTVTGLESEIQQLQAENRQLNNQIQELKLDLIRYQDKTDLISQKTDQLSTGLENDLTHWWSLLSILLTAVITLVVGGIGILAPYLINKQREKQLQSALEDALEVKKEVEAIKELINNDSKEAKAAAREAKASQYFAEALAEEDPSKKKELYTKAIELNPYYSHAYCNRGIAKKKVGDLQGAIEDYNKAIELKPLEARNYNNRGVAKSALGDKKGAIEDYDEAIALKPDYPPAYNNRGNAKRALGAFDEAKEDIDQALRLDPNYAPAYDSRGEFKFNLGDTEGAIKDYSKAIELKPQKALYYRNRALCYRKMAETETDETKKNEYLAKAEEDEKRADSLDK